MSDEFEFEVEWKAVSRPVCSGDGAVPADVSRSVGESVSCDASGSVGASLPADVSGSVGATVPGGASAQAAGSASARAVTVGTGSASGAPRTRRPDWLRVQLPQTAQFAQTRGIVNRNRLHTVCESANCPNIGECWSAGTATFMILGNVCTRSCGFCAVLTGRPPEYDEEEPTRVAEAIASMNLVHVVLTSVDRDEREDGGSVIWAETIRQIRARVPRLRIEVLIPDFKGDGENLDRVLDAVPDILAHNVETVPRLHKAVRPQAQYERSLGVLAQAKGRGFLTKSSLMLGLGETEPEVEEVLRDLRTIGCDILTLGQYLQPSKSHLAVERYAHPDEFARLARTARGLGFAHVESGPLVRSSYHAERAGGLFETPNVFSVDARTRVR